MSPETIMTVGRQTLEITAVLAAPPLLAALVVGLLVSLFQAATQINEATLSFIPKLLALAIVMLVTGHWMLTQLIDYTRRLYESIPTLIG
ncbi:flagellar biosynthesis protein FliQ [Gammaproteobacteria bacterium]